MRAFSPCLSLTRLRLLGKHAIFLSVASRSIRRQKPRNSIMGSTDTDIEELENATYQYLTGERTEKMWQRLKAIVRGG
nr:calcium/calmodulin-dependent 3',5'-cyclic nucleotide phosphodiesterase 1A-like [Meriones unguiculatus]